MNYWQEFITVALVHLLAVMSPGPDFAMIARSSLLYGRRTGVWSSVGLAGGIVVHITYCLLGIGLIISKSILLFNIIKLLGAGYLVYIGIRSLLAKVPLRVEDQNQLSPVADLPVWQSIRLGFLTNALNPKATVFFLALFTQVIRPSTPTIVQMLYGLEMAGMTFVWFALVSLVLSHGAIKKRFAKIHHQVERGMGVVLVALGLKVALSKN